MSFTAHLRSSQPIAEFEDKVDWSKANCRGMDPGMFIPDSDGDDTVRTYNNKEKQERVALCVEVCRGCNLKRECLILAAQDADTWRSGVWGGTTEGYRKRLLKRAEVREGVNVTLPAEDYTPLGNSAMGILERRYGSSVA